MGTMKQLSKHLENLIVRQLDAVFLLTTTDIVLVMALVLITML